MSDKKARFEARDVASREYVADEDGELKYTGPERRKSNRRTNKDRRTEVRFDPTKQDRRKNQGRRKDDNTPKFW